MCRFAAYLGPAQPQARMLYDAPHSLERQAYVPREMVEGHVNVDGTGVAWWPEGEEEPLRYVTVLPPWSDPNLPHLAPRLLGRTIVASVRSATPGIPTAPGTVLPFVLDGVAGLHNGFLRKFRQATAARCLAKLPEDLVGRFEGLSDSLVVFLLAIAARREDPDLTLADALVVAAGTAARTCAEVDAHASLNLVLAAGREIVALRFARGVEPNSLYLRDRIDEDKGATIASEPLDEDPAWRPVPADHVVRVTAAAATVAPVRIEL